MASTSRLAATAAAVFFRGMPIIAKRLSGYELRDEI